MTDTSKFLLVIWCCLHTINASHGSHNIPIEGYETNLQVLGQHVELSETPVKIIKITKTVAVKVPVPYPVKIREKVPYPVHVAKPYPVPVPQIVKVPAEHKHGHGAPAPQLHYPLGAQEETYQVHESSGNAEHHPKSEGEEHHFHPSSGGYSQLGDVGHHMAGEAEAPTGYDAPSSYGGGGGGASDDNNSFESKTYDQAIKEYLSRQKKY